MFTVYGALGWEWRWIGITWSHPRRLDGEGDVPTLCSKNGQGLPVPLLFLPWKEQVVELKRMVSILYLQKPHVHIWLPCNGKVIIIGMFIYIPYFKCSPTSLLSWSGQMLWSFCHLNPTFETSSCVICPLLKAHDWLIVTICILLSTFHLEIPKHLLGT